jgi:hypothetical protein
MEKKFTDPCDLTEEERHALRSKIKESSLSDWARRILRHALPPDYPPEYADTAGKIWKWHEPCPRCGMFPRSVAGDGTAHAIPGMEEQLEQVMSEINDSGIAVIAKRLGWTRDRKGKLYDAYHLLVRFHVDPGQC